ncbi:MAG TPA: thioredoxin domain-containing protein [Acidothermaceae bacterium]|jgi:protein-disulfide isomerase|uniref:DsbA family protein n=1 Tax=Mycobacterium sp. TaxID=1785 RepID=UPI002BF035FD|nr:thioredoxin domain-containing protein [Mycobacterium sp.]HTH88220.1 thioredoxin domain-containing protein [Mycobacterium sp.]HWF42409.1 thioredoxin domain-containing protein [Acidothermaceae bacterium]
MRISRTVVLITAATMIVAVGCTKQVAGTAESDPNKPPLTVSKDGYGIVAGFDNAPTKIEIYTEPQCNHCADLQHDFGDQLAYYIAVGQLEVTYRPMTFLDDTTGGYSGQVSNALFLATQKTGSPQVTATGTEFQHFVENVWAHQRPGGNPPTGDELLDFAKKAGMPDAVAQNIKGGGSAVNVKEMDDANFEFLYEIDSVETGTPTVYDLGKGEKLDIYDNNWLTKLVQS